MMKIKIIISFLVVLAILTSCKKELAKAPKRLIDKDKMVNIIYDLSLLGAIKNQNAIFLDSFKGSANQYIYKKYKIDSIQFAQSNIFYAADVTEYKKMYDAVKMRLDKEKVGAEVAVKNQKKKADLLEKKKKALKVKREADSIKKAKLKNTKEVEVLKKKVKTLNKNKISIDKEKKKVL